MIPRRSGLFRLFVWLSLIAVAHPAAGQISHCEIRFETLTIDHGLSQNMVHTMAADGKGFLWIGTSDGLNRFDGKEFTHFRHIPESPASLPANVVLSLFEDSRSRIWVGTSDGVAVFEPTTETMYRISDILSGTTSKNSVHAIAEDLHGNIWLGSSLGLYKVFVGGDSTANPTEYDVERIMKMPDAVVEDLARTMVVRVSSSGHVYMGCNAGLYLGRASEPGSGRETFRRISETPVSHMVIDRKEQVWFGAKRLHLYKPIEGTFQLLLPENSGPPRALEIDPKGNVWVSHHDSKAPNDVGSALYRFDAETLVPDFVGGAHHMLISLAFTGSDVIWGGTPGFGLDRGDLKSAEFRVHPLDSVRAEFRYPKGGAAFFPLKGNPRLVRVRSGGGTPETYYDLTEERDRKFGVEELYSSQAHLPGHITRIFSNVAIRDDRGHYWGFIDVGKNRFDFAHYDSYMRLIHRQKTDLEGVNLIYIDPSGALWAAAGKVLARFDPETRTFQKHQVLGRPHSITTVSSVLADRKGVLWLGTDEGLVRYDPFGRSETHYRNTVPALGYGVLSLLNDPFGPDEFLWVGTEGGGLVKLEKSTGAITRYTEADGLPNLVVYGILPDVLGRLWLSTNNGLVCLDTKSETFAHFTREDGLPTNEFNRFMYGILDGGRLWFESLAGIVAFDPLKVGLDTVPPKMVFTQVKSFNEVLRPATHPEVIDGPVAFANAITLPWRDNVVTFNYTTLDFRAPGKNLFSTQMLGVDKTWSPPVPERTTTYAHLAPGEYVFRVRASNSNGVWNEEGIAINLTILAPWWQTGWAYTLYALLLLAVVYGLYKIRINRVRLQYSLDNQRLEADRLLEVDRLKNEFFSNITHEFRTPITLIINPIQRLLAISEHPEEKTELKRIHRNANQLLRLINQLLDLGKIDSGMMRIDFVRGEMVQFLREIVDSFSPLAQGKNIGLTMESSVPYREVLFDPGAVEKIAYNLISNAIKYTPKNGNVKVYLDFVDKVPDSNLILEITDDGPGIEVFDQKRIFDRYFRTGQKNQAGGGKGIGLALVREITQLYGGEISVETAVGEGSRFTVVLPIPESKENPSRFDGHVERTPVDTFDEEEHDGGSGESDLEKPLVLVVEDNEDLRGFLHNCLAARYTVIEAENGLEGYEVAVDRIPDAVLCDVMMPVLDGMGFLEKLKENQNTSHIPVIMLTAKTNRTDRENALRKGADAYLTKPFYETELLALLNNLLSIRAKTWNLHRASVIKIRQAKRNNAEEDFMDKLQGYIEEHLSNPDIGVNDLCRVAAMSRTQLHRKLKALTGFSTGTLIRKVRMEKAREMLENQEANISEVAFMTGFNTHSYFSKCFADVYGMTPTEYQGKFKPEPGTDA